MLDRLDALPGDEVKELVAHSYNMVAAKAPLKKVRNSVRKKKQNSPRAQRKARAKKH
jgi:hypothetical protein